LDFQFTDWSKKVSFQTEREVSVPEQNAHGFVIPGILLFASAEEIGDPFLRNVLPFTWAECVLHRLQACRRR